MHLLVLIELALNTRRTAPMDKTLNVTEAVTKLRLVFGVFNTLPAAAPQ